MIDEIIEAIKATLVIQNKQSMKYCRKRIEEILKED